MVRRQRRHLRGSHRGRRADLSLRPGPRRPLGRRMAVAQQALSQRAMALDLFVSDCYGVAARDPPWRCAGPVGVQQYRLSARHRGHSASSRHLVSRSGIDVVRVEGPSCARGQRAHSQWHRLRARIAARDGVDWRRTGSSWRRSVRSMATQGRLRRILQRIAPRQWDADIVVLTPGSYNAAYYEHRLLADEMRATLVEGHELIVVEDEVYRLDAEGATQRVDVIYSRVNSEWLDPLVFRRDSMLGAPGLIEAWRRGNVAIANAPGTGVADDKVIYPYVPAMIRYYLGEEPLMDNVPTYDLTDDVSRHMLSPTSTGWCSSRRCKWRLRHSFRQADGIRGAGDIPGAGQGESAAVARTGGGRALSRCLPARGWWFRAACRGSAYRSCCSMNVRGSSPVG